MKPSESIAKKAKKNYAAILDLTLKATENKAPSLWLIASMQTDAKVQAIIDYLDEQANKQGCQCTPQS